MPDYSLVPVDHQPDFDDYSLVPVDYDPFAADGVTQQAQIQQPAQPQAASTATGAGQPTAMQRCSAVQTPECQPGSRRRSCP